LVGFAGWGAGNSFGADKFGNRLTIVLKHDPPASLQTSVRAMIVGFAARLSLSSSLCDGM
jgi:hypothetical protein